MTTLAIPDRGAALKEWAAAVLALEAGTQILILRKGGIREEGFSADTEAFYLYPTGFHQGLDKLRPEHAHLMHKALAEKPPEGRVRIRSFGRLIETFSIASQEKLVALAGDYVYTVDEMKKRHEFRPGDALTAMAVRVFLLPAPVEIPVKTKYGGCVSWVNLEEPISTEKSAPALADAEFHRRLQRVRSILNAEG